MCFLNDGAGTIFDDSEIRARKPRRCDERGCEIRSGDMYRRVRGKWEGEMFSTVLCLACERVRARIAALEIASGCMDDEAWAPIGFVDEWLREHDLTRATVFGAKAMAAARAEAA